MSFEKAGQLIELLFMAKGRYQGVSIQDVMDRFDVSKRTAQRMLHKLEELPSVEFETRNDGEGRKRWRLSNEVFRDFLAVTAEELASLEAAVEAMVNAGRPVEAEHLRQLENVVRALARPDRRVAIETDEEAILEAQGFAARPGPRPVSKLGLITTIGEGLKSVKILEIEYSSRREPEQHIRRVEPYGLLYGVRQYLVARDVSDEQRRLRLYRIESLAAVRVTDEYFERDPGFSLGDFAKRAFGSYQKDDEYGEIVWKFVPKAANHARSFQFHPDQQLEEMDDGSILVKFKAAGHLEMCWHLYSWGDTVEVIEPQGLRDMCEGFARSDFPALP